MSTPLRPSTRVAFFTRRSSMGFSIGRADTTVRVHRL
jgi:hypothetical protein